MAKKWASVFLVSFVLSVLNILVIDYLPTAVTTVFAGMFGGIVGVSFIMMIYEYIRGN